MKAYRTKLIYPGECFKATVDYPTIGSSRLLLPDGVLGLQMTAKTKKALRDFFGKDVVIEEIEIERIEK